MMDKSIGAIKRVISDPEEQFGRKAQRVGSPDPPTLFQPTAEVATFLDSDTANATPMMAPAIVERDDFLVPIDRETDTNRPMSHINQATSKASTTSSSLSDDRSNNALADVASRQLQEETRENMIRNDSRLSTDSSISMLRSVENSSGNWGWFEDVHSADAPANESRRNARRGRARGGMLNPYDDAIQTGDQSGLDLDSEAFAVTAPTYVLEESLSSQQLWKHTAGTRPPQPVEERAFFEQMWAQNFAKSQVNYHIPVEVLTATTPISLSPFADGNFAAAHEQYAVGPYHAQQQNRSRHDEVALLRKLHDPRQAQNIGIKALQSHQQQYVVNKKVKKAGSDSSMTVLVRGDNVFGTTVSKSFARKVEKNAPLEGVNTVNISIASYRVVETKKHGKYAQYLVIYREGNIRDTIGVWKRYSDFVELSRQVMEAHISCASVLASMSPMSVTKETDVEHLPNAITSWRLLKKRQRWYRCLDAGYLSLKVFLLERFLHDILFESSSPKMLRDFVGAV